jgi:hypothetical protein
LATASWASSLRLFFSAVTKSPMILQ